MAKRDDILTTEPAEIERLIERLKQYQIEQRDALLIERLPPPLRRSRRSRE